MAITDYNGTTGALLEVNPLPEHLRRSVRINWHISSWCNYSCEYCPVMVFHQRSRSGQKQEHSFDHRPVADWLQAIRRFDYPDIFLKISGGEPFLDRKNFRDLLRGLSEMPHIRVGVDSNGFWDPDYFRDLDKRNLWLDIAFHPTQVSLDEFLPRLLRMRAAGFQVLIVNYVLAPENLDRVDEVVERFEREGLFVNVSTMIPTGVYLSRSKRTERELDVIEKYSTPLDNYFKIIKPKTKGRLCFYPAMTYYLMYDGTVRVACLDGTRQDLFEGELPQLPREAVPCEYNQCVGCSDMYRGLVDEPMLKRPPSLFTLEQYVQEVQDFRKQRKRNETLGRLPLIGSLFRQDLDTALFRRELAKLGEEVPLIQINGHHAPEPSETVFGRPDQTQLDARSRDRISISGWAASKASGAPLAELHLEIADRRIGEIREFFYRPDIAETYGRSDLAKSGWRTMLHLPKLAHGEYDLVLRGVDHQGNSGELPPIRVRIAD